MRILRPAAALAAVLALAACEAAPTLPAAAAPAQVGIASTNQAPVAAYQLSVLGSYCVNGMCGYSYKADAAPSYDPDGYITGYEWIEDGVVTSVNSYIYVEGLRAYNSCSGSRKKIYLRVTDNQGATSTTCLSYTPL